MEKIINKLIDYHIKDVDIYTHGGSTWLIFTKTKQWVIELTDNKTLWYNYNFFNTIFSYASLEVVQNQHLITKWVEDNVINGIKSAIPNRRSVESLVEDTLENGVKQTNVANNRIIERVEDAIDNGVKETKISPTHTEYGDWLDGDERLDNIIQNGIKETQFNSYENKSWVEGVIKGGVKQTLPEVGRYINDVEEVIEEGIKETKQKKNARLILDTSGRELILESHLVIRDGVKETNYDTDNYTDDVKEIIREGVKKTLSGLYIPGAEMDVNHIIDNGVKSSNPLQYISKEIIDEVVNDGIKETHDDVYHHKGRIDGVINNGVKEIYNKKDFRPRNIGDIIENGIKETHPMENSVNSEQWFISEQIVNNHIQTGIKKTKNPTG